MPDSPGVAAEQEAELEGAIDKLVARLGKYTVVMAVAKRARDLKERADARLEPSLGGLVTRAARELARGDVRLQIPESEITEE